MVYCEKQNYNRIYIYIIEYTYIRQISNVLYVESHGILQRVCPKFNEWLWLRMMNDELEWFNGG